MTFKSRIELFYLLLDQIVWPVTQIDRRVRPGAWEAALTRFIENQVEFFHRSPAKLQQLMPPED